MKKLITLIVLFIPILKPTRDFLSVILLCKTIILLFVIIDKSLFNNPLLYKSVA